MSKFDIQEVIIKIVNEELQQELRDSLDIILHKIKFINYKAEACIVNTHFKCNEEFSNVVEKAGGVFKNQVSSTEKLICIDAEKSISEWISHVIQNVHPEWESYQKNQIYIIDISKYQLEDANHAVQLAEDLAEIMYPGLFIYGGEGTRWIQFETFKS